VQSQSGAQTRGVFAPLRKGDAMSVNVKNGTPLHGPSLCESCMNAHILSGFSESELDKQK